MASEHYLPQFLLRGFTTTRKGRHYAYYFRQGHNPVPVNTRNIAAEEAFYGTLGTTNVERVIQRREDDYALLVERLRSRGADPADKAEIDAFICHLLARGRHIRDAIREVAASSFAATRDCLVTPGYRAQLIQKAITEALASPEVQEVLSKFPLAVRPAVQQALLPQVTAYAQRIDFRQLAMVASLAERHLGTKMGEMLRDAQGKALVNEPPAGTARSVLQPLEWSCRRHRDPHYILGDVAVFASFAGAAELKHVMNSGGGTLQSIFLPLSSRVLLIGATPEAVLPDDHTINCSSAELSRDFFVAEQDTERERTLFQQLGARSTVIDEAARADWVAEFLRDGTGESENAKDGRQPET